MLDKSEQLSFLVARQMITIVTSYAKLPDYSLTPPQYFMLETLAQEGKLTSSYFAKALDITLPAVTNLSNKLVAKGFVERIASAEDRRQIHLQLTAHGREVHRRMLDKYKELTEGLWDGFGDSELALLISSYEKVVERLQAKINDSNSI